MRTEEINKEIRKIKESWKKEEKIGTTEAYDAKSLPFGLQTRIPLKKI